MYDYEVQVFSFDFFTSCKFEIFHMFNNSLQVL